MKLLCVNSITECFLFLINAVFNLWYDYLPSAVFGLDINDYDIDICTTNITAMEKQHRNLNENGAKEEETCFKLGFHLR